MEPSTLAEILVVEKEIRAQLDAEREQASRWLEAARRADEQAHQAELAQLRVEAQRHREAALQAARARASAAVQQAAAAASAQEQAGDELLRALVRRHLAVLVPGSVR